MTILLDDKNYRDFCLLYYVKSGFQRYNYILTPSAESSFSEISAIIAFTGKFFSRRICKSNGYLLISHNQLCKAAPDFLFLHSEALNGRAKGLCLPTHRGSECTISCGAPFTPQMKERHKAPLSFGGEGGIRTHVPLRTTAFRVRRVMTTSLLLRILNMCKYNRIERSSQGDCFSMSQVFFVVVFRQNCSFRIDWPLLNSVSFSKV